MDGIQKNRSNTVGRILELKEKLEGLE